MHTSFANVFDQLCGKTSRKVNGDSFRHINIVNVLYGLRLYLCNQRVLKITQMTMRYFFSVSKGNYNFYILDIKITQTQDHATTLFH